MFQQSLYTDVTLPDNVDNAPHRALFRTLITKPELARCVRSLAFQCWEHSYESPRNRSILEPDGNIVSKIVRESSGYTEEEKQKWTVDLRLNYEDAWIALIIPRLPRLRKLTLSYSSSRSHVLKMFKNAAHQNGGPCLRHLEEVFIACDISISLSHSSFMHPFSRFSSAGKVDGWKAVEPFKEEIFDTKPIFPCEDLKDESLLIQCPQVTEDYLIQNAVPTILHKWILACKEVNSFRLASCGPDIPSKCVFNPQDIGFSSFYREFSKLDTIWIELGEFELKSYGDIWWIGSLPDFPALKCILAHLRTLRVFDKDDNLDSIKMDHILPSSLQTLFLRIWEGGPDSWQWGADPEICEGGFLNGLLEKLNGIIASRKFPGFKALHIDIYEKITKPENLAQIECLQKTCRDVGVSWSIRTQKGEGKRRLGV